MERSAITFLLLGILCSYSVFAQNRTDVIGEFGITEEFSLESESLLIILDSMSLWDSLSRTEHPCSRYDDSTMIYFCALDSSFNQVYVYFSDSHCALVDDWVCSEIKGVSKFRKHPIVIYRYLEKASFLETGTTKKINCIDIHDDDTNNIIDKTKFYTLGVLHLQCSSGNYFIIGFNEGRCDKLDKYYPRTISSPQNIMLDN